jgi:hypothetical protein
MACAAVLVAALALAVIVLFSRGQWIVALLVTAVPAVILLQLARYRSAARRGTAAAPSSLDGALMAVVFYLVVVPAAFLVRLFSGDVLGRRGARKSYWVTRSTPADGRTDVRSQF